MAQNQLNSTFLVNVQEQSTHQEQSLVALHCTNVVTHFDCAIQET